MASRLGVAFQLPSHAVLTLALAMKMPSQHVWCTVMHRMLSAHEVLDADTGSDCNVLRVYTIINHYNIYSYHLCHTCHAWYQGWSERVHVFFSLHLEANRTIWRLNNSTRRPCPTTSACGSLQCQPNHSLCRSGRKIIRAIWTQGIGCSRLAWEAWTQDGHSTHLYEM